MKRSMEEPCYGLTIDQGYDFTHEGERKPLGLTDITIIKYYCFVRRLSNRIAQDFLNPPQFPEISPLGFLVDISNLTCPKLNF